MGRLITALYIRARKRRVVDGGTQQELSPRKGKISQRREV